jgi:hypothetical protein
MPLPSLHNEFRHSSVGADGIFVQVEGNVIVILPFIVIGLVNQRVNL